MVTIEKTGDIEREKVSERARERESEKRVSERDNTHIYVYIKDVHKFLAFFTKIFLIILEIHNFS